jgi:hypothetical protein
MGVIPNGEEIFSRTLLFWLVEGVGRAAAVVSTPLFECMTQCSACVQHQRGGNRIAEHGGPVITSALVAAVAGEQVEENEPGDLSRQEEARPALRKRQYTRQE